MHQHFKLFKPYNCHSQFVLVNNKKKTLLGDLYDFPEGTMAIGRLDKDSEGLLFLTTNGALSELVRSSKIEKEYYAQVDGEITKEALTAMMEGVSISQKEGPYLTKPCKVKRISEPTLPDRGKPIRGAAHGPTTWISITLTEGKYRQVRKMTAAVGFPTLRLVRYRIGNETISDMQASEVREVNLFDL